MKHHEEMCNRRHISLCQDVLVPEIVHFDGRDNYLI